jgi:hypothetical protein
VHVRLPYLCLGEWLHEFAAIRCLANEPEFHDRAWRSTSRAEICGIDNHEVFEAITWPEGYVDLLPAHLATYQGFYHRAKNFGRRNRARK